LEKEHIDFIMKEMLDVNKEPQKSYMSDLEWKVSRAIKKHRTKLQLPPGPAQTNHQTDYHKRKSLHFELWRKRWHDILITSWLHSVKDVNGPGTTRKLKSQQSKIKAKATAISNLIGHSDITSNPKAMTRAGIVWSQIEKARCEYQTILDAALEALEGSEGLAEALAEDENQWEELMIMKVSSEKRGGANADNAFKEEKMEPKDGADYHEFLRVQTAANMETEKKLSEQEDKSSKLEQQLDNMRSTKSGKPITDPKSAMRLPTCPPPMFTRANVDYIPWKRTWEVTMGKSYMEEVQLMQLKLSIPARTSNLIGLSGIRTMADLWNHMDKEYLDYNALSWAIADIKNLDRKDSRFLQMMKVKLTTHRKNLEINNMGHCITSDEMVREHWLPLLTEMAKERKFYM
jgi:hypothetical protein